MVGIMKWLHKINMILFHTTEVAQLFHTRVLIIFIKKRKPQPKVDLDPETDRIWKLLMGSEGSESMEATDKDKEKWWEEERKVFRGRADSFIARMHLVQGNELGVLSLS